MFRRLAILVALTLLMPATAQAASLTVSGGVLQYTATPGRISNVTFVETTAGNVVVTRGSGDNDDIVAIGCPGSALSFTCGGVTSKLVLDAGDMSDRLAAGFLEPGGAFQGVSSVPVEISGGDGNDALAGGARSDRNLDGGPGDDDIDGFAGDDILVGGTGNDTLRPNTGTDTLTGGDGVDIASYGRRSSPMFTLDGVANDGGEGENDLIGTDVEGIEAAADDAAQTVRISGDGRANRLAVSFGRANIVGGEGADFIEGGPQDDMLVSRDGSPDTVVCNGGIDIVVADTLDTLSPSCEIVQTQASPGGPFDDRPPNIVWSAPAAGVTLTANSATTLAVNATDDRGIARVQFLDDDRVLCDDTEAPYTCAYRPRGGDVGRNTLIAVAVDGANQTTSIVRPVSVRRFEADELTATLRPGRDRRAPYAFRMAGRLVRPEFVSPSQGCSGTVVVTAKRGSRTVSTKRATLGRTCEYQVTFRFRSRTASRLRIGAKFSGNDVLTDKTSRVRTARLG